MFDSWKRICYWESLFRKPSLEKIKFKKRFSCYQENSIRPSACQQFQLLYRALGMLKPKNQVHALQPLCTVHRSNLSLPCVLSCKLWHTGDAMQKQIRWLSVTVCESMTLMRQSDRVMNSQQCIRGGCNKGMLAEWITKIYLGGMAKWSTENYWWWTSVTGRAGNEGTQSPCHKSI